MTSKGGSQEAHQFNPSQIVELSSVRMWTIFVSMKYLSYLNANENLERSWARPASLPHGLTGLLDFNVSSTCAQLIPVRTLGINL